MNRIVFDTGKIREFMERTFCNMFTVCFIFACDIIFYGVTQCKTCTACVCFHSGGSICDVCVSKEYSQTVSFAV